MPDTPENSRHKLEERLEQLDDAIYSGVQSVNFDGQVVTFRSIEAMKRLRHDLRVRLGLSKPRRRMFRGRILDV